MSQVHQSAISQPIPVKKERRAGAAAFAAIIAASAIAAAFAFSTLTRPPAIVATPQHENLVDGWMPAAAGAEATRLASLQDGYLPGLVAARQDGDLTDGYMGGLISARQGERLVDGYLPGLVAGRQEGDLIDGYLRGLTGTGTADTSAGWKSALVR
jgi:hypothetical protein